MEVGALRLDRGTIQIPHLTDRLGHAAQIADRLAYRVVRRLPRHVGRIMCRIGEYPAGPAAAEPTHAMADVEEERLPLLFAIVRYVDTGGDLLRHHLLHCRLADTVEFR